MFIKDDGNPRFYIHCISPTDTTWAGVNTTDIDLRDGLWHHLAVTFDTTDMVATLYLDGDILISDTVRSNGVAKPKGRIFWKDYVDGFFVGSVGTDAQVKGSMDEVDVYNSKLSAEEIKKMVAEKHALNTSVTGNGSVTPSEGLFYTNDTLMLTAVADDGWGFVKWDKAGTVTGTDNPVTVTVSDSDIKAIAVFEESSGVTDIEEVSGLRVYPNPFHHSMTVSYELEKAAKVNISIYNSAGQLVNILLNEKQTSGIKTILWNGTDALGNPVNDGIYLIRMQADNNVAVIKLIKK